MSKNKTSFQSRIKKSSRNLKYAFVKDESGHTNQTLRITFEFICLFPIVIFEGIKVGIYARATNTTVGIEAIAYGLFKPFITVLQMRHQNEGTGFLNQNIGFSPLYITVFLFVYVSIFTVLYINAERNKNKSYNKDGDMKFASAAEFNEAFAYCDASGTPIDPPENSEECGNMITSEHTRYALEPKGTYTFSHTIVYGVSGSGKSMLFVKPNILQMNASYVVTDPKGELTRDLGMALMRHGYTIKVFNISTPEFSCKYNPFHYVRSEEDVVTMVNTLLENTKIEGSGGGDPFFPLAEKGFYLALCFYIYTVYKESPEKQTFKKMYELFQKSDEQEITLKKGETAPESEFDKLFLDLAKKDPTNPALPHYATFKKGTIKTRQSILTSVGIKMWFLSVPSIANLLSDDTLELEKIGDRKTALFIIIPSEKDTYKFLSAMLFTQLFETLYYVGNTLNEKSYFVKKGTCVALRSEPFIVGTQSEIDAKEQLEKKRELWKHAYIEDDEELMKNDKKVAEYFNTPNKHGIKPFPKARLIYKDFETGEKRVLEEFQSRAAADLVYDAICNGELVRGKKQLVNHVRFMLDEFYSIGKIDGFDLKIATCRSIRISCAIIIQSLAHLKEMYEDREAKIINNCNVQILLGASSSDDSKYFSDLMGQTTVVSESHSVDHKGLVQGVSGSNLSDNAQLLLRPENIRTMKGDMCLVIVNTMMPVIDKKYSALNHPRWKETYSDHDPINTRDNEFQLGRLFFIEQKKENLIQTVFSSNPELLKDAIRNPRTGIQGHPEIPNTDIPGVKPNNTRTQDEKYGINPRNRNDRYERIKADMRVTKERAINRTAQKYTEEYASEQANENGEINTNNLSAFLSFGNILKEAAKKDGTWRIVDGDTQGTKRIESTESNKLAKALKDNKNIKPNQIVTNEDDALSSFI